MAIPSWCKGGILNEWQQRMGGRNRFAMVTFSQSKYHLHGRFGRENSWLVIRFVLKKKMAGYLDKVPFY
jgi:hypothetical protein